MLISNEKNFIDSISTSVSNCILLNSNGHRSNKMGVILLLSFPEISHPNLIACKHIKKFLSTFFYEIAMPGRFTKYHPYYPVKWSERFYQENKMIRANKTKSNLTIFYPDRTKAKSFHRTQLTHSFPISLFLYSLKTSESLTVFWCF